MFSNHFHRQGIWNLRGTKINIETFVKCEVSSCLQAERNCFDYIAQIIDSCFGKNDPNHCDMERVIKQERRISNKTIRELIDKIAKSNEYKYVRDYCNTVKHNYEVGMGINWSFDENITNKAEIHSFTKGENVYDKVNGIAKIELICKYITSKFKEIIELIKEAEN